MDASAWKYQQVNALKEESAEKFGPVEVSWLSIKLGLSSFLGNNSQIQNEYRAAIIDLLPQAANPGDVISGLVAKYGADKNYNLRRLYERILRSAGVPKGTFLLKKFDFRTKTESLEPIP